MKMWKHVMFMVLMSTVAHGGAAELEQQKAEAFKELQDLEQKTAEREKALTEQTALADARKAADAAEAAFRDFTANNAEYVAVVKARGDTSAASGKALENAKVTDTEYPELRKKIEEIIAKRQEAEQKLREAAADAQAALKEEIAALGTRANDIEQKKAERRKILAEQPELAEANKAAVAAETAYQEFVKNNAEYAKLVAARNESGENYRKALEDAKNGDADYRALKEKRYSARSRLDELDRKIAEAK